MEANEYKIRVSDPRVVRKTDLEESLEMLLRSDTSEARVIQEAFRTGKIEKPSKHQFQMILMTILLHALIVRPIKLLDI